MADTIMANAEQGHIDIDLCDGKYVVKFDSNNISEKTMDTLKRAVFNALKPKEIKPRTKLRITDLTPEQLAAKRASRIRWYNKNKATIKIYKENKYNTDYDYWKRNTEYARERHRREQAKREPKKRGRPRKILTPSTIASDDDEVLKTEISQDKTKKRNQPETINQNSE